MSITVAEALTIGEMRRCKLIAGQAGLSREVQCVDTMEMPDIYPWLQKNELLMTTGYSIQNDGGRLIRLLYHLNNIGGAGLAMTTQFVGRFTEEVMQLADKLALPLIEIPSDVPFTALTNPVMKAIVDNQNKRLRFSEGMNKKFIDLEINGGGFQQIADVLGVLLERCVLVTDASFCVLAMSAGAVLEDWLYADVHGRRKLLRKGWRSDGEDRYRAGDYYITCKKVMVRKRLRGFVLSATGARQEDEDEYKNIALHHAATSIALEFSKLKSMEDERQMLNNNLFLDLMLKNVASEEDAAARANGLNWPRMPLMLAVLDLVRFEKSVRGKSESEIQELKEAVASIVHDVLCDASFPAVLAVTSDMFNCLFPRDCDPDEVRRILSTAMERIETECGFMSKAAVSQKIGRLIDMPVAQRECRDAMRIGEQASSQNVVFVQELLPELVFMNMSQNDFCQEFARETLRKIHLFDRENNAHLVETIAALYTCGGRKNETVARLYLHRNTLAYRLRKIEEITGLSMEDARNVMTLGLAAKILLNL